MEKYNSLTVKLIIVEENKNGKKIKYAICDCECGKINIKKRYDDVKRCKIQSCGCLRLKDRTGEISKNSFGSIMTITKYKGINNIEVTFENGFSTFCRYAEFKSGKIYNPLDKTNYNVGYFGIGKYNASYRSYFIWKDMFKRCYDLKYLAKFNTYIGCCVCNEWYNYQVFAKWYEENYYELNGEITQLDKDILIKGNKIYSPKTCCFIPHEINYLLLGRDKRRGEYPIGVYLHSDGDKYVAQCHDISKKPRYLGRFNTVEEAFKVYKEYKEKIIKQVADKYYGLIPDKVYQALYNYKVDITD